MIPDGSGNTRQDVQYIEKWLGLNASRRPRGTKDCGKLPSLKLGMDPARSCFSG